MKILFITDNFLPHVGGSRVIYYNICRNLPKDSVVMLTKKVPGYREFDKRQEFKIIRANFWTLPWKWLKIYELPLYLFMFLYGLTLALKEKIDIIHCGEALPSGLVGFILGRILNRPYIVYAHAEDITIVSGLRTEGRVLKYVLKKSSRIISSSSFVRDFITGLGIDGRKISVVLPAIDDAFLTDEAGDINRLKAALGISGRKIVLSVCRLIERKGIDRVILALPDVLKSVPDLLYLIIGDGPQRHKLESLVKEKSLEAYVRFLGEFKHNELHPYYRACDLFVMPNRKLDNNDVEGFGVVFIEAGAFAKPVIGGDTGGSGDSIKPGVTGLRVNSEEPRELSREMVGLLTDAAYAKRLGEAGRERVINGFRWPQRAKQVYDISQDVINQYRQR